jgi:glycosyltransferase involved in cell wall biosynthesis
MKILHIIPSLFKGGAERLVLDIIKQTLKIKNIEVRLVIFRDEIAYDISEFNDIISIIPASVELSITKKWKINIADLQSYINEYNPDIIHTHLFEAELVSRFCHYPKAIWFSHFHDNMVQFNKWSWSSISKTKITNWYEKKTLFNRYKKNRGTHFIAISKHTESYIKSVQSKYPVTLLHNAINVDRFLKPIEHIKKSKQFGFHSTEDVSLKFSTENDNKQLLKPLINIINIGSFVLKKNQNLLLDILSEFVKKNIEVKCFFIGDGPLKIEVEKRAQELGISTNCIFSGNVNKVEEYLWQSDVYVHTANYEPLGLVLLEAMAAGLPVVTLDGGGNRDLVINGKNGFLIQNQNPEEFADRIIEVYQNKEMSDFNSEFAKQFDIESYCEKLLNLYKQEH